MKLGDGLGQKAGFGPLTWKQMLKKVSPLINFSVCLKILCSYGFFSYFFITILKKNCLSMLS